MDAVMDGILRRGPGVSSQESARVRTGVCDR